MEFLRKQGVPYKEVDVSKVPQAAQEVMRLSGQMGVPVIADGQEVIVGFDVGRLQRMAARHAPARPGLGLRVKDAEEGSGAYVGSVRPDSPAERAGAQAGDIVEELSGAPVRNAADLERIGSQRRPGEPTRMTVRRNGERRTLILPPA
jgi:S1-C subfamily serine protease